MHILIIGAGRIGRSVAENLVNESNDITIVDQDAERVSALETRLDLRGVTGNALSPSVLESAGANDADMILAVTANDETNMAVCLLASQLSTSRPVLPASAIRNCDSIRAFLPKKAFRSPAPFGLNRHSTKVFCV